MESSGSGGDDDDVAVVIVVVVAVEVDDGVVDGATQLEPCGWMIVGLEVVTGVLEECDIALLLRVVVELVFVMMILVVRSFVRRCRLNVYRYIYDLV